MTPQEAINIIEDVTWQDNSRHNGKIVPAREIAISALEKQVPKKPKKKEENQYSTFYDCPCCGGYLVSKIDGELCGGQKYKYCYRCGQALDWSDTE